MSDDSHRGGAVRPARVWQPLDTPGKQAHFVAQDWPTPSARIFNLQQVTAEPGAQAPSGPAHAAPSEVDGDPVTDASEPLADGSDALPAPTQPPNEELLEQVRTEAFARGVEASRVSLRAEMSAELAQLQSREQAVVTALQKALDELQRSPQLFEPLKRLALHLAEQLVLAELTLEPRAIERLVQRCVDELALQDESPVLVALHPDDLAVFQALRESTGLTGGATLRLHADTTLLPGSVRASANDALVEDLIENKIVGLARGLLLDEPRWRAQTSFEPERRAADRLSRLKEVEDAQPRMTSPGSYSEVSAMTERVHDTEAGAEEEGDA